MMLGKVNPFKMILKPHTWQARKGSIYTTPLTPHIHGTSLEADSKYEQTQSPRSVVMRRPYVTPDDIVTTSRSPKVNQVTLASDRQQFESEVSSFNGAETLSIKVRDCDKRTERLKNEYRRKRLLKEEESYLAHKQHLDTIKKSLKIKQ